MVFSTWKRQPWLASAWRPELYHRMAATAKALDSPVMEAGGTTNHVHLLMQMPRTETLARAVGVIKSRSSTWIRRTRETGEPFQWQAGYCAFSLSPMHIDPMRYYIRNQETYHRHRGYQREVRAWLSRYGLAWDERYLWE